MIMFLGGKKNRQSGVSSASVKKNQGDRHNHAVEGLYCSRHIKTGGASSTWL